MSVWHGPEWPEPRPLGLLGWGLALGRTLLVGLVIYGLLIPLVLVRLVEAIFGRFPISPLIVQLACKISVAIIGIRVTTEGRPMRHRGAVVANHSSWFDIIVMNSVQRVLFVAKAEVRKWPVIGFMAAGVGTVFIERRASHAKHHQTLFEKRLLDGHRLLFFPEGTSSDSRRVLPFKSTLFQAFFAEDLVDTMWIQPVSAIYTAPKGEDARFYGWWGDMPFLNSFLQIFGTRHPGSVRFVFHHPVAVSDFDNRKALTDHCYKLVNDGLLTRLPSDQS